MLVLFVLFLLCLTLLIALRSTRSRKAVEVLLLIVKASQLIFHVLLLFIGFRWLWLLLLSDFAVLAFIRLSFMSIPIFLNPLLFGMALGNFSSAVRFGASNAKPLIKSSFNSIKSSMDHVDLSRPYLEGSGIDPLQWSANPYAQFDYRHTWWQKLWEGLGFRSRFDEYRDSMALNAREYESDLAEKAHNEAYDSPLAQVERQRQAGLNPDLNGSVDSGSSSPMEPDPNGPIDPGYNDPVAIVQGFANTIFSAFTGSIGLAKDALSLSQMRNDVESGNLSNSASIVDYAMNLARQFIPASYPEGNPDWANQASDLAFDVGSSILNKRQQKQLRRALNSFYSSAPTQAEQWKAWNESQTGKLDYFKRTSSEFFGDGTDEVLRVITDNLMKVEDKIFKQDLNLRSQEQGVRSQELENTGEYLQSVDPSLQGQVENITNERNIESGKIDYYLNEALSSIVEDLRDKSESGKKGHGFAQVALLVFSVLRMMNFSKTSGFSGGKPVNTTSFGF